MKGRFALLLLAWAVGCSLSHNPDLPSRDGAGDGDGDLQIGTGGTAGDGDTGGTQSDHARENALGGGGAGPQ